MVENFPELVGMRPILNQIGNFTAGLCIVTAAQSGLLRGALGADDGLGPLVTAEMYAQLRPEIREQLDEAAQLAAFNRPDEALALLGPLQAELAGGTLNYWETFDLQLVVGQTKLKSRDWRAARSALEFHVPTDVDAMEDIIVAMNKRLR